MQTGWQRITKAVYYETQKTGLLYQPKKTGERKNPVLLGLTTDKQSKNVQQPTKSWCKINKEQSSATVHMQVQNARRWTRNLPTENMSGYNLAKPRRSWLWVRQQYQNQGLQKRRNIQIKILNFRSHGIKQVGNMVPTICWFLYFARCQQIVV